MSVLIVCENISQLLAIALELKNFTFMILCVPEYLLCVYEDFSGHVCGACVRYIKVTYSTMCVFCNTYHSLHSVSSSLKCNRKCSELFVCLDLYARLLFYP